MSLFRLDVHWQWYWVLWQYPHKAYKAGWSCGDAGAEVGQGHPDARARQTVFAAVIRQVAVVRSDIARAHSGAERVRDVQVLQVQLVNALRLAVVCVHALLALSSFCARWYVPCMTSTVCS